jgi:lactate dehydrogenase-like 2-hydroxyacid dehydrogenase
MSERTAGVTGGGTGIGRAIAELFDAAGMKVVCLGMEADADLPSQLNFSLLGWKKSTPSFLACRWSEKFNLSLIPSPST